MMAPNGTLSNIKLKGTKNFTSEYKYTYQSTSSNTN